MTTEFLGNNIFLQHPRVFTNNCCTNLKYLINKNSIKKAYYKMSKYLNKKALGLGLI